MKKIKFFMGILTLMILTLYSTSCKNDSGCDCNKGNNDKAFIKPSTDSQDIFDNGLTVGSDKDNKTISFSTNKNWTAKLADIQNKNAEWCEILPQSGEAGNAEIEISFDKNTNYDERSVVLTIKAGEAEQKITLTQKQKDAVIASKDRYDVGIDGGKFEVELKSNIAYKLQIPDACKDWIDLVKNGNLKSMKTDVLSFHVAKSSEHDDRHGEIYIVGENNIGDTIRINQTGNPIITSEQKTYPSADGGTFDVDINTNCEYGTIMPKDAPWLREDLSRGLSSHTLHYIVDANTDDQYSSRQTQIIYYDRSNTDLRDTLVVTQLQKDAIIISDKDFNVGPGKGQVTVKVKLNVDAVYSIDPKITWIHARKQKGVRGLQDKEFTVDIDPNSSFESRKGEILVYDKNNEKLGDIVTITQTGVSPKRTIKMPKAGVLADSISDSERTFITDLTIKGDINGNDIRVIRAMAGLTENNQAIKNAKLVHLDLSEANIVEGGDYYYIDHKKNEYFTANNEVGRCMFGIDKNDDFKDIYMTLKSLILPNSATKIDDYAAYNSYKLETLTMGQTQIQSIGGYAFAGCSSLTALDMPSSLTKISSRAFDYCNALSDVTLPEQLIDIEEEAFANCSIKTLVIPNSVESIGSRAFNKNKITKLTLGSGINNLGQYAFSDGDQGSVIIQEIHVLFTNPNLVRSTYSFIDQDHNNSILYVPKGHVDDFKYSTNGWELFKNIQEEN